MTNIANLTVSYNVDTCELIINGQSYGKCHKLRAAEYVKDKFEMRVDNVNARKAIHEALRR